MKPEIIDCGPQAILDHSFSEDESLLAVARGTEAQLWYNTGSKYELGARLEAHDKTVTAVDVSALGQIVTCAQDRNAYVWEAQPDGTWRPTLVLLRLNRAATCCRWNPEGTKFAVGSADRIVAVCYYEAENDWWISKHIKKPLRSTVLSIDWHPNGVLLACGATDGHARVFSGYVKQIDSKPIPTVWGERLPFQTLCGDFCDDGGAWVHDVAFSPSGDALAWVTHDSSVLIAYPQGPELPPLAIISIDSGFMPFHSLVWTSESQLVAAGYDCHPVVFEGSQSGWKFVRSLDDPEKSSRGGATEEQSALKMFKQLDLKGTVAEQTTLPTIHQNAIRTTRLVKGKVSTSGDGLVVQFKA